jgi:hypothetical protein
MKYLTLIVLLFSLNSYSQDSQISGTIYSADTTEVIPFTYVYLISKSDTIHSYSDLNGNYKFNNIRPDTYNLKVQSYYSGNKIIKGLSLNYNDSLCINVFLRNQIVICGGFCWRPPTAYPIGNENQIKISQKDIKSLKTTQIIDRIISLSSDFHKNENQISVRGTRSKNVIYYVDGIRQNNTPNLPRVSVNSMDLILGGIPAKYGETTSGVISISTVSYFDLYYDWKSRN